MPSHGKCLGPPGTTPRPLHPELTQSEPEGIFCCKPENTKLGCEGSNGGQSEELTLVLLKAVFKVIEQSNLKFWLRGSSVLGVLRENSLTPNCVEISIPIQVHHKQDSFTDLSGLLSGLISISSNSPLILIQRFLIHNTVSHRGLVHTEESNPSHTCVVLSSGQTTDSGSKAFSSHRFTFVPDCPLRLVVSGAFHT